MELFTTSTEILVLFLISSTFIAMGASSAADSITDQRALTARFHSMARSVRKTISK